MQVTINAAKLQLCVLKQNRSRLGTQKTYKYNTCAQSGCVSDQTCYHQLCMCCTRAKTAKLWHICSWDFTQIGVYRVIQMELSSLKQTVVLRHRKCLHWVVNLWLIHVSCNVNRLYTFTDVIRGIKFMKHTDQITEFHLSMVYRNLLFVAKICCYSHLLMKVFYWNQISQQTKS